MHENKIGLEPGSSTKTTPAAGVISAVGMTTFAPLQDVFDTALIRAGREPMPLWRGYQINDNKDANGESVAEKWKYVAEDGAEAAIAKIGAMFSTVCASSYRKDSDTVDRVDMLQLSHFAYFDFDGDSIADVLPKVRQFIGKLQDKGANPSALHIYASGGKGFHVLAPLAMFLPNGAWSLTLDDMAAFHILIKEVATALYVDTLDLKVYTAGRQWRQANVERVSGKFKTPVTYSELMAMDADMYARMVSEKREPITRQSAEYAPDLALIWSKARDTAHAWLRQREVTRQAPRVALAPKEAERYASALFHLDPDEDGYAAWRDAVAATNHFFGSSEAGFDLIDEWSKQGKKYNQQALRSSWEGLSDDFGGSITANTVFDRAIKAGGWVDPHPELNPRNQVASPAYRLKETDEGFSEHVAALYGDRLRYVSELKTWAAFDGRSWVMEHGISTAKVLAKQEARAHALKVVATQPANDAEEAARKKSLAFAIGLENGKKLETIVTKMADDPRLITSVGMFDDKPYLVNLVNGTYDLERDEMRGHDAGDYLTQRSNISRDPNAKCPRWLRFMDEITCGNKELATYLQCIAGLCLSGDVSRQEAYTLWGQGSNGKSVFTGIIRELCGDYFKPLDVAVLVYSNKPGQNNTEMAALRGARAVATSELERGVQLRSGNFKDLTGGDAMQVSDKYIKAFTLKPQCTILIPTNHLPTIVENDLGTWRRVRIIPFKAKFEGAALDPDLSEKLKAESPGILNWAIDGFRLFRTGKMETPLCVQELSTAYRDELNIIKNFTEQYLVEDEEGRSDRGRIKLDDLYFMYQLFCKASGLRSAMSKRMFKEDVGEYLLDQTMQARQPVYQGWRIRAEYVPENVLADRFSNAGHAAKSLQPADEADD